MRRRRRDFAHFSLSFLDCMSCGLGAVVLLFMIIHHASEVRATASGHEVATELSRLESEVLEKRESVEALAAALERAEDALEAAKARAVRLAARASTEVPEVEGEGSDDRIGKLQQELRALEKQLESLRDQEGNATRSFAGSGNRQYLTGLRVGGKRILILVDTSASMLGERIVEIIRRRNLPEAEQRKSAKWRRAVATVDWLTTQVPAASRFQIYAFDETARPVLAGTDRRWLDTGGGARLSEAVAALGKIVPSGGTSLYRAIEAARDLSPSPDVVYLLTDGLPTQGGKIAKGRTVSGAERLRHYAEAANRLPRGAAVNILLFPIEGDPVAESAYWQLAQATGGAFLSPPRDWP